MKMLDLFSGIGGFSLAAKWADIEVIGHSEIDKFCCKILEKNFPNIKNYGDIRQLIFTDNVNLITGGFPCQPFSGAGKRRGKNDERYLWGEFYRVIKQSQPCWVVIENVVGLLSLGVENIITDLENENYEVKSIVLPACAANAPHRRDRVWIIANCPSERCNNCCNNWKIRPIQENKKWNLEALQQKWSQLKPKSWETYKAGNWIEFNARNSRADDGVSDRVDRLKSVGNSIVPQLAFIILSLIKEIEENN